MERTSIRHVVVEAMNDCPDPHPMAVAELVIDRLPPDRYVEAMRECLWLFVRNCSPTGHDHDDPHEPFAGGRPHADASAHVATMGRQRLAGWLRERVSVAPGRYKFAGDCTAEDCDHLAAVRRDHAKSNAEAADRWAHAAALLRQHRADRLADLPADLLGEVAP